LTFPFECCTFVLYKQNIGMEQGWILLISGIMIGWLTKVPFLIRYYRKARMNRDKMQELYENIIKHLNIEENERTSN
jgi:hypothetical protein